LEIWGSETKNRWKFEPKYKNMGVTVIQDGVQYICMLIKDWVSIPKKYRWGLEQVIGVSILIKRTATTRRIPKKNKTWCQNHIRNGDQ